MKATRMLVLAAMVAAALGCSPDPPPIEEATTAGASSEETLDSMALIEGAMNAGVLDYSTGTLYKVYVMFDPLSLPEEYASDVPVKCGTPLIVEVQRNWNRLLPEHRTEIEMYITPIMDPTETETDLDDVTPDRLEHERNRLD